MAKSIHMMIRVLDEKKSVDFYAAALGLAVKDRFQFDDFTLVYLKNAENDFEIELTVNHGRSEPYTHGTGYGHVALSVADVDAEHRRLVSGGLEPAAGQGVSSRWQADGQVLLSAGSRRLQDRGAAAPWPLHLRVGGFRTQEDNSCE